jgi:hypothetical protein
MAAARGVKSTRVCIIIDPINHPSSLVITTAARAVTTTTSTSIVYSSSTSTAASIDHCEVLIRCQFVGVLCRCRFRLEPLFSQYYCSAFSSVPVALLLLHHLHHHHPSASTALSATGVARNPNHNRRRLLLPPGNRRRRTAYLKEHPEHAKSLISLGIGDTTQPIPPHILSGLGPKARSALGVQKPTVGT